MSNINVQNTRVIANANSLISRILERIDAIDNRLDSDKSLDSEGDNQPLKEVQQLAHMLLGGRLAKAVDQ